MTKEKVAIIGASHGGHEAALELLTQSDNFEVTIFEAGDFVSFMSCGMTLYLTGRVPEAEAVRNFKPADIESLGGHVLNNTKVTGIDADKQMLTLNGDAKTQFAYDKLILSVGVTPARLALPGSENANIVPMRGYESAKQLKAYIDDDSVENIAVIGAGYIGIEAVEAMVEAGKHVTVLDLLPRVLGAYLDADMTTRITDALIEHGVAVHVGEAIKSYKGDENGRVTAVVTDAGEYPADVVIEGIGVKANTSEFADVLQLDQRGWIETDRYLRTNLPNVYAIGDAIKPFYIPAGKQQPVALASTARREAQYVAHAIINGEAKAPFKGVVGASALSVFEYSFASAGLNEVTAQRSGVEIASVTLVDTRRPAFVPDVSGNGEIIVRLAYTPETQTIVGGAVMAKHYDVTAHGNTLALAIAQRLTLTDLAEADFFFQPGFDRQWSSLNLAAQKALGYGEFTK